ncbi:MAG: hypothetical protein ACI83I_001689 [Bacteroidia bacterium]|jgi:hypothetical protein
MLPNSKKCKVCKNLCKGRSNKIFCSIPCKNFYHKNLRYSSAKAGIRINEYLNRNHGILTEIISKNLFGILDKVKYQFGCFF